MNNNLMEGVTKSEFQMIPQMDYNNHGIMNQMMNLTQSNISPDQSQAIQQHFQQMSTVFEHQKNKALMEQQQKYEEERRLVEQELARQRSEWEL